MAALEPILSDIPGRKAFAKKAFRDGRDILYIRFAEHAPMPGAFSVSSV